MWGGRQARGERQLSGAWHAAGDVRLAGVQGGGSLVGAAGRQEGSRQPLPGALTQGRRRRGSPTAGPRMWGMWRCLQPACRPSAGAAVGPGTICFKSVAASRPDIGAHRGAGGASEGACAVGRWWPQLTCQAGDLAGGALAGGGDGRGGGHLHPGGGGAGLRWCGWGRGVPHSPAICERCGCRIRPACHPRHPASPPHTCSHTDQGRHAPPLL